MISAPILVVATATVLAMVSPARSDQGMRPSDSWSYQMGDERTWADPAFDSGGWPVVSRSRYPEGASEGVVWFRCSLEIDSTRWGRPVPFSLQYAGAVEVYLDGELVRRFGRIGDSTDSSVYGVNTEPVPWELMPSASATSTVSASGTASRHVIALRYAPLDGLSFRADGAPPLLNLKIGELETDPVSRAEGGGSETDPALWVYRTAFPGPHGIFLIGVCLAFAFLHVFLFVFHPAQPANMYYTLFLLGTAGGRIFSYEMLSPTDPDGIANIVAWEMISSTASILAATGLIHVIFLGQRTRTYLPLVGLGVILSIWQWFEPFHVRVPVLAFFLLLFAEITRTLIVARLRRDTRPVEGRWILAVGILPLTVIAFFAITSMAGSPSPAFDLFIIDSAFYAVLFLIACMSLFLASDFARTSKKLVRANAELESYSHTLEERVEARTQELREKQSQLVQAGKMASLGQLVAGVAHEINNPVGAVNGAADVAGRCVDRLEVQLEAEGAGDQAQVTSLRKTVDILRQNVGLIAAGGGRIASVVRSLRDFARLDEAEFQSADLHQGLDSVLDLLRHEVEGRVTIIREYGGIPPIDCYPRQLNQVFMNLLLNAAEAIDGEGTITLTTVSDGESVTVRVADTGRGIPEANLDRIFDPGFTTKGVGVGVGLGLAISFNIAREHGGTLGAQSEDGKGTVFTLTVPIRPTD
ncbi:MAG: hypothetical protein HN712_28015 [Gemmatimonadetes bacterium]|jgi:signal transduction histidine kinase|nr:hypothetical protein [Gemmatimonadota bacterium]MBT6144404.1 hypothetical protein [Gemmatimonadota bacterium]MBT7864189.1 hypothetical protein [Gemmatimonadota bacterium]